MGYPEDVLHRNEELILDLHPHWWSMARSVAALAAALVLGALVLANGWPDVVRLLSALLVLAALGWFLSQYVSWVSTHFVLTSDRLIYRSGVLSKRGIEIPLERINTILSNQHLFERLLGFGDLEIESASTEGSQHFDNVQRPDEVRNEIYQQIEANEMKLADRVAEGVRGAHPRPEAPPPPVATTSPPEAASAVSSPGPSSGGSSVLDQIEQLARLRDRGVINDEEFQAAKRDLLGRL